MNRSVAFVTPGLLVVAAVVLTSTVAVAQKGDRKDYFVPLLEIPSDKAVLYIYAPSDQRSGNSYRLSVNKKELADLKRGTYYTHVTEPGKIEFETKLKIPRWRPALLSRLAVRAEKSTVDVEAGKAYYLRATIVENPAAEEYDMTVTQVAAEVGEGEAAGCRLAAK